MYLHNYHTTPLLSSFIDCAVADVVVFPHSSILPLESCLSGQGQANVSLHSVTIRQPNVEYLKCVMWVFIHKTNVFNIRLLTF